MLKDKKNIINKLFPSKKVNIFIISIIILGIISGSIFSVIINENDKNLIIEKITLFIDNIHNHNYNYLQILKNSISVNLIYILIIFILGFTIIGIIINPLLLYLKSFIIGFTLSSFIIVYNYSGLLLSTSYIILGQVFYILSLLIISSYSIFFSYKLFKLILGNRLNIENYFKNYCIIFVISILLAVISSLFETFIFPSFISLFIKLYI